MTTIKKDDKKPDFEIDTNTIRSKEQFDATQKAAKCGCAWCLPEKEQKSPKIHEIKGLIAIRSNVFPKEFRKMFLIHPLRHTRKADMTNDEILAMHEAEVWLESQLKEEDPETGGGFIRRWGSKKCNASSLPDDHCFISVVVPDGTGPVKETLCKSQTPEDQIRRSERAAGFEK